MYVYYYVVEKEERAPTLSVRKQNYAVSELSSRKVIIGSEIDLALTREGNREYSAKLRFRTIRGLYVLSLSIALTGWPVLLALFRY